MEMDENTLKGLELVLTHYQSRLNDRLEETVRDHYEAFYLQLYHELHQVDSKISKPYMDWWVHYAKW